MRTPDNFEGLISTIKRDGSLALGQEINPTYITTAMTHACATGTNIYRMQAIGEDATITNAKDMNGVTISGLTNAVIPNGQFLIISLSAVTFSDPSTNCSVQIWERMSSD